MDGLSGKVALVLGGARGVGLAVSRRLVSEGATVLLTGRRVLEVDAAVRDAGRLARGLVADAGDADDVQRAVADAYRLHGGIDLLVVSAGTAESASLADTTPDHFDRLFGLNVRGPLFAVQAAAEIMRHGGSVVLLGSIEDAIGSASRGTYASTKAALRSYARSWALELSSRSIRVNVVSPGPTDSGVYAHLSGEARAALKVEIPLRRFARAEEVAAATAFLLSDEASFVTGAELCVDGGMGQV